MTQKPYKVFIGRWSPFHNGHAEMILQIEEPYLIMVRDTKDDPWDANLRADMVSKWLEENDIIGLVMVIPDIEGVYYGRGVGYEVEHLDLESPVSGTEIRELMEDGDDKWKELVPPTTVRVIQDSNQS